MAPEEWGVLHPYYLHKSRLRVPWSDKELDFVKHWKMEHEGSVVSACLLAIQCDKDAYSIFHCNHIRTPARLAHAWKKASKKFL